MPSVAVAHATEMGRRARLPHRQPVSAQRPSRGETKQGTLAQSRAERRRGAPIVLASGHRLRGCIVAALKTGCRVGELLSLACADVEKEDGQPVWLALKGERTKTGQARVVPVTATLATILATRRHDPNGEPHRPDAHVLGNAVGEPIGTIATAFTSACVRAGIDGLRFHDLRRTAASRFLQLPEWDA